MKCMILDENIGDHWKEITDSLGRQHIDEYNNNKKKLHSQEASKASQPVTAVEVPQLPIVSNEDESGLATQSNTIQQSP